MKSPIGYGTLHGTIEEDKSCKMKKGKGKGKGKVHNFSKRMAKHGLARHVLSRA